MKKQIKTTVYILFAVTLVFATQSCSDFEKFEPLGENSIADVTPPSASFTATQGVGPNEEWKDYTFANASNSATTYAWDFGDGNTSAEVDGENTYPGEGTYTVTLVASDAHGVTSTYSEIIEIVQPEEPEAILPIIKEPGFEDNSPGSEDCGSGMDGRDCWRNGDLGGVIQITSSPVQSGSQAAKFPSAGDRVAYQELTVSPNVDYILKYYYTLKTTNPGSLTVSVLAGGGHIDLTSALDAALASFEGTDQSEANAFVLVSIPFNTGANDIVSILVTNQGEEARADSFSIEVDPN